MIDLMMAGKFSLKEEIVKYLKSKGKIRAVLLHKLLRKFSNKNSQFKVKKSELFLCLKQMTIERLIDIIIPELFEINWETENLSDLLYIDDGNYFIRKFSRPKIKDFWEKDRNTYLFDSRIIDFKDPNLVNSEFECLERIRRIYPKIKYKIIIYYPKKSKPLNIYEPLEEMYNLTFQNFSAPENLIKKVDKIQINKEDEKSDLFIIQSYRKKYMCFYITLIESIQYTIMELIKNNKKDYNHEEKIKELINKFGYYCEMFVKSDWVETIEPNPYRWETFFLKFNLPIKILNLEYKSIQFHGRTFECWAKYRYCIFIDMNEKEFISNLKKFGYQEFSDYSNEKKTAIGAEHEIFIPCPSIEHFFFMFKYICYYHLFLLLNHSFSYLKKSIVDFKLTSRDQTLYRTFLPVMKPLFEISVEKVSKRLVFSYYSLNPDELEVIYNKFLVNKTKDIENKLFKYFLLRCAL